MAGRRGGRRGFTPGAGRDWVPKPKPDISKKVEGFDQRRAELARRVQVDGEVKLLGAKKQALYDQRYAKPDYIAKEGQKINNQILAVLQREAQRHGYVDSNEKNRLALEKLIAKGRATADERAKPVAREEPRRVAPIREEPKLDPFEKEMAEHHESLDAARKRLERAIEMYDNRGVHRLREEVGRLQDDLTRRYEEELERLYGNLITPRGTDRTRRLSQKIRDEESRTQASEKRVSRFFGY
jgi:uncharacterized protein YdcH (DUF465 family)